MLNPSFTHTLLNIMNETLYMGLRKLKIRRGCVTMSGRMHFLFDYCENPSYSLFSLFVFPHLVDFQML